MITLPALRELPFPLRLAHKLLRESDPLAVMAGGCLRDFILRRPIKDIDIFVGPHVAIGDLNRSSRSIVDWDVEFSEDTVRQYAEHFGATMSHVVKGVWEYSLGDYAGYPWPDIQVIVMKNPVDLNEVIEDIDFGFCQIGASGAPVPTLAATPQFFSDAERKVATLTKSARDPNYARSACRAERLSKKYPDFYFDLGETR